MGKSTITVWFRFGSVRFRFLVFAIGPVRFMFGFGSCGSCVPGRFRFGSVFGIFRRRKSTYRLLPATGFMSSGFQRAERAELGEPKLPDIVNACNLFSWNLLFSLNSKSNYNLSNQFTWRAPGTYRLIS